MFIPIKKPPKTCIISTSNSIYFYSSLPFLCFLCIKKKKKNVIIWKAGALLSVAFMQVLLPTVAMPTCVRRRFYSGPAETRWGPGIITGSLWSPKNRPVRWRNHRGGCCGEHMGSQLRSKGSARWKKMGRRRGKHAARSFTPTKIAPNPHF